MLQNTTDQYNLYTFEKDDDASDFDSIKAVDRSLEF